MNQIGLLGATGYTGRLMAKELVAQGIPFKLGIRDESKLSKVFDENSLGDIRANPDKYRVVIVDVADKTSLQNFYGDIDTVVSTVGPFCKLGKTAVEVAADTNTNYIDSTGEPEFMKWIYANFDPKKSFIVPACGFDYLPGDLISNMCLNEFKADANAVLEVTYAISHWIPTRGTAESALIAFANLDDPGALDEIEFLDRKIPRLRIPWGEEVTVNLHHPNATVSCYIKVNKILGEVLKYLTPITRLSAPLLERTTKFLPEGPADESRKKTTYDIYVKATFKSKSAYGIFNGVDIYGTTAIMLILSAQNAKGCGVLAPSQLLEPGKMLKKMSEFKTKSTSLNGASCNYSFVSI